ncbi:MAG: hypothetical protein HOI51_01420, partial [Nitrosomonadales bacterium]|nr:hypothetical protein [Nitrosomonadales bacterium]
GEIETLHKTLDKMKNRFKFNSSVKVDSSGLQTEEVELDEDVNSEIKDILGKEKISHKIYTSKHKAGQKGIITGVFVKAKDEKEATIALRKISPYPHTIVVHAEEFVKEKTFSEKVKESISEFGVESLLAEDNVDVLKSIVKSKSMKPIKLRDGTMKVDLYTASAIVQVLDKINPANKAKLTKMLNGKKSDFMRASEGIMKMIGKTR